MNTTSSETKRTKRTMRRPWCVRFAILLVALECALGQVFSAHRSAVAQESAAGESTISKAEIDALVSQLGAKTYRVRERAEAQLESAGLLAFEALLEQRDHEDIEIRLRSRRLVETLRARFLRVGVEPALEPLLEAYAKGGEERRALTIEVLAGLLPQQAINELARIARFEESSRVSKLAARAILRVPYPSDLEGRVQRAERIEAAIGFGDRVAIRWLRLFATALRGEYVGTKSPAELWESLLQDEKKLTQQEPNDGSSLEVVNFMHRLLGDFYELHGDQRLALEARKRVNDSIFGDDDEVVEWMDWLMRRSAWPAVIDLAEQNQKRFERHSMLLYGLAEAQLRLGEKQATIDATLERANLALPIDEARERYRTAVFLEDDRGLFDWAEREYRHILKHVGQESVYRAVCFRRLAEMFHAEDRGEEAHDVMLDLMQEVEESEIVRAVVENQWALHELRARTNLYMACHYRDQGEPEKQRETLERAIKFDPTEADVLIAMYRVKDADEVWKKKTLRAINNAVEQFRRIIYDSRRASEGARSNEAGRRQSLSSALNQLAWLVSNTEGDYAEALRMSKKSLELAPGDAGIMDTLGRCFYSVRDYDNAVKYQRWALQRSPHEGHVREQLQLFEAALAESPRED